MTYYTLVRSDRRDMTTPDFMVQTDDFEELLAAVGLIDPNPCVCDVVDAEPAACATDCPIRDAKVGLPELGAEIDNGDALAHLPVGHRVVDVDRDQWTKEPGLLWACSAVSDPFEGGALIRAFGPVTYVGPMPA